ncbi:MAG: signal peptidase I [Sphaerochaetaceae bacterium]|nr:signal peptidase I [Sphaerochaetaceae bacterium]
MEKVYTFLEKNTVRYLTKRKALKAYEKSKKKTIFTEIYSWVDALVFAVIVVMLINQFFFQLFVIPSPSMVSTLLVGDRVVVSKLAYGLEPYPAAKNRFFTSSHRVERDDIITFYNPEYESKGPFFDILSQAIYMGTLSLVNIDRNEDGSVAERLYVKRAIGFPGDQVRVIDGNIYIRPAGYDKFISEEEFRKANGLVDGPNRSADTELYDGLKAWARLYADNEKGNRTRVNHLINSYEAVKNENFPFDLYEFEKQRAKEHTFIDPSSREARGECAIFRAGIYVPNDYILPLGDNRDNSHDGRYFGPVGENRINGRVIYRFWPLGRASVMTDK